MTSIKKGRPTPEGSSKVITIQFKFPITDEEARQFIKKPNSPVSKRLKKYLFDTLTYVCKKAIETEPEEE